MTNSSNTISLDYVTLEMKNYDLSETSVNIRPRTQYGFRTNLFIVCSLLLQ